eukprot:SAG31_NODE_1008_length_10407_cov_2.369131_2_plen_113_part_00
MVHLACTEQVVAGVHCVTAPAGAVISRSPPTERGRVCVLRARVSPHFRYVAGGRVKTSLDGRVLPNCGFVVVGVEPEKVHFLLRALFHEPLVICVWTTQVLEVETLSKGVGG